ncbi:AAA-like domain-containing protein [Desertifilum sp. FACHB-1129]|uniref:GGDEF domain-containing protein n=1 Tax=Desertifilum tharense IPPAS B-1220 TaxID=1781255 RepID=A0A1E5QQU0_9CYAN|nr:MULTISPECIES: AAA-like domain-containing protein [Desertifilum]MDA0212508.1 AAA-like domain-containing protein [Cyanobacteria bacterium FC1]MBD2313813.1 AAA-like domain-containing protein [Desertifilum sp. FACHB-1129]MBD2323280.1 AAA-like domain-containing protein [Desertifilum sp. FACHB-866]MBD2333125.1 AAA-like domain-containing protein [Desertifilum sp. FACHB-868]OEJ76957.1 hypothetical protein BH720_01840 [Desertifilum tharense IPPAS B-1220]
MISTEVVEFPGGPLPLNSPFYVYRPPQEELVCQEVEKPGSAIRIQAPRKMGKSSLLTRLLAHAKAQGYGVAHIDFQEVDRAAFGSLDKLLRWLCANVSRRLRLPPQLDDYWDEEVGSKVSCTIYFEEYLLEQIDRPIVLALNEVNLIFEHSEIAQEFFPLLRYWYEQAKHVDAFQKLRLVIVHSTEVYVPLKINQSPFNVGLPIRLADFNLAQAHELADRYGLTWDEGELRSPIDELLKMVGGNPYRLGLAFYYLRRGELTLDQLLKTAPTSAGIYSAHLQDLLIALQQEAPLKEALWQAIAAGDGVAIDPVSAYKLNSLGLVSFTNQGVTLSCELYRLYFQSQLFVETLSYSARLQELKEENQRLKYLVDIDSLTQLANRRSLDRYLAINWQQSAGMGTSLALILLDVDDFKAYNDTYGHPAGDRCLRQIAGVIHSHQRSPDLVARYGGEEFAIVLPQTNAKEATELAEKMRVAIKSLAIPHENSKTGQGIVTVSIGVACVVSCLGSDCSVLLLAADKALYHSKHQGRDLVTLSEAIATSL